MREHVRVIDLNSPATNAARRFRGNSIATYKYNLFTFVPLNLYEQFHRIANIYFLLIAILQQIPGVSPLGNGTTALTLAVVMGFTAVKEALEDWDRHKNDAMVNNRPAIVCRDGVEVEVAWRELAVGDVVRCMDKEFFPADLLLLASSGPQGMCYIETSNLDGETNLKIRQAHAATAELYGEIPRLSGTLRCDPPNAAMYSFNGELALMGVPDGVIRMSAKQMLLRESQLRNTKWIYGLVIYTGKDTKIMKSSNKAKLKKSNVERVTNTLIILVFLFELLLCVICALGNGFWLASHKNTATYLMLENLVPADEAAISFFTFLILFSNLIPISLYVSMETVKFAQSKLIDADINMYYAAKDIPCISRTSSLNEELGQVEYIFSDKTGTLTCNLMEFKKMTIAGRAYGDATASYPIPQGNVPPPPRIFSSLSSLRGDEVAAAPFVADDVENCPHFCFADEDGRLERGLVDPTQAGHIHAFMELLAVCHTVIPEPEPDAPRGLVYQAASPDEGALVNAAAAFGWWFHERTPSSVTVDVYGDGRPATYDILHVNAFNSTRKRMSVVVRTPESDGSRILVLCKGADTMLYELLDPSSDMNEATASVTLDHLDGYAKDGLRTLVCAYRELDPQTYAEWQARVDTASDLIEGRKAAMAQLAAEVESNLTLLGATAIEDKLQDDVPNTIADLRAAGIKIWVLTGDKQETAIMIGKSARLLDPEMRVLVPNENADDEASISDASPTAHKQRLSETLDAFLAEMADADASQEFACVVDGATLEALLGRPGESASSLDDLTKALTSKLLDVATACKSVIGCRVSPAQKAQVVEFVQTALHPVTLAIGDGANDVDMIMSAEIGIGINGEEGGQASLSADYAVGQFRFLRELLLVHGHWCYRRIATLILYSFYKNIALALVPFFFVFVNGFSGQSFVEKWTFSLYNVIYTALPILVVGVYDQCLPRDVLLTQPELYRSGPAKRFFNVRVFIGWMASALYHSAVCYYVTQAVIGSGDVFADGQTAGLYFNGIVIMTVVVVTVTLKVSLETNSWTVINWIALAMSVVGYFVFVALYSLAGPAIPDAWDMYFVGLLMYASARFWLALILVPVMCLVPDLMYKAWIRWFYPEPYVIAQERTKLSGVPEAQEDAPLLSYSSTRRRPTSEWKSMPAGRTRTSTFAYDAAPSGHVDLVNAHGRPPRSLDWEDEPSRS